MRTKEEIAGILAKRKVSDALASSTWADLVASIQLFTPEQRNNFVRLVANGNTKTAGEKLKQALYINAQERARADVDALLADDSLTIGELDSLI